jgi:adenine deaminase
VLQDWQRALRITRDEEPADLLLRNCKVVNVFTCAIEEANVAIADGRIVGVGTYDNAHREIDVQGAFVTPSFIDGHIHIESSLLWISEFARAVIPHGTGGVVTDPHEIANVAGLDGFKRLSKPGTRFQWDAGSPCLPVCRQARLRRPAQS